MGRRPLRIEVMTPDGPVAKESLREFDLFIGKTPGFTSSKRRLGYTFQQIYDLATKQLSPIPLNLYPSTKRTLYRFVLPYCIRAVSLQNYWILLNREYKPLGQFTGEYVDYDRHPSCFNLPQSYKVLKNYFLEVGLTQLNETMPIFHLYTEDTDPFKPHLRAYDDAAQTTAPNPYPSFIANKGWVDYQRKLTALIRLDITYGD